MNDKTTEINTNFEIREQARHLATTRANEQTLKALVADLEVKVGQIMEMMPQYIELEAARQQLHEVKSRIGQSEKELREAVLADHQHTGEKHYPGAQVKLFVVRKYDPTDALNWCMDHNVAQALKLDKRQFDKIADVMKPDFVETHEEARVYIDGDLSEFLEERS